MMTESFQPLEDGYFALMRCGESTSILVPSACGMTIAMSAASSMDLSLSLSPIATMVHSISGYCCL